jgi:hypothetical protein
LSKEANTSNVLLRYEFIRYNIYLKTKIGTSWKRYKNVSYYESDYYTIWIKIKT